MREREKEVLEHKINIVYTVLTRQTPFYAMDFREHADVTRKLRVSVEFQRQGPDSDEAASGVVCTQVNDVKTVLTFFDTGRKNQNWRFELPFWYVVDEVMEHLFFKMDGISHTRFYITPLNIQNCYSLQGFRKFARMSPIVLPKIYDTVVEWFLKDKEFFPYIDWFMENRFDACPGMSVYWENVLESISIMDFRRLLKYMTVFNTERDMTLGEFLEVVELVYNFMDYADDSAGQKQIELNVSIMADEPEFEWLPHQNFQYLRTEPNGDRIEERCEDLPLIGTRQVAHRKQTVTIRTEFTEDEFEDELGKRITVKNICTLPEKGPMTLQRCCDMLEHLLAPLRVMGNKDKIQLVDKSTNNKYLAKINYRHATQPGVFLIYQLVIEEVDDEVTKFKFSRDPPVPEFPAFEENFPCEYFKALNAIARVVFQYIIRLKMIVFHLCPASWTRCIERVVSTIYEVYLREQQAGTEYNFNRFLVFVLCYREQLSLVEQMSDTDTGLLTTTIHWDNPDLSLRVHEIERILPCANIINYRREVDATWLEDVIELMYSCNLDRGIPDSTDTRTLKAILDRNQDLRMGFVAQFRRFRHNFLLRISLFSSDRFRWRYRYQTVQVEDQPDGCQKVTIINKVTIARRRLTWQDFQ